MNLLFAVLYIFLAVGANAGVKYSAPAKNPNETDLGSSIEGSEITNDTIQSTDIQDFTIIGNDISSNTAVAVASTTVGNVLGSQVTTSTGALVNSTKPCASGFTRLGASICLDTDSVKAVDITSVPLAGGAGGFQTTDLTVLNGTKARHGIFKVNCQTSQDATDGSNDISLYMQKPGSGSTLDNTTKVCNVRGRLGSAAGEAYYFDMAYAIIPLDSNQDVAYNCASGEDGNDVACYISVVGYLEQE